MGNRVYQRKILYLFTQIARRRQTDKDIGTQKHKWIAWRTESTTENQKETVKYKRRKTEDVIKIPKTERTKSSKALWNNINCDACRNSDTTQEVCLAKLKHVIGKKNILKSGRSVKSY